MATNPYSYGSLGQRWTVGEPTSKSLLDISRVKADANRWTLEQLITDPDDSATLGFGLSFASSEQRLLQIHNTDVSKYFQIYGGRAGSPTSDHLVFSTGTNGTIMEFDGVNHWITFHDTAGVQKMYYRGDGSPGLILESGVFLTVGGLITASAGISGTTGTFSGATTVGSAGATADFAVWTDGTSSTAAGFTVDASADEVIVGQLSGGGNTNFKVRNRLNNTVFQVTPDAPSTTVFAPNIATGSAGTLTVKTGSINSDSIRLEAGGTTSTWLESRGYLGHSWYVDSTRKATLDATGLGIGTSSPSALAHLYSNSSGSNTELRIEHNDASGNATAAMRFKRAGADFAYVGGAAIAISGASATDLGLTVPSGKNIVFATNNTERLRILSSGGLTFNGDTSTANALDDYEEGTFTPTLGGTTTSPTVTYSTQAGTYTKVGRLVTVTVRITTTALSGGAGLIRIDGLPYTQINSSDSRTSTYTSVLNLDVDANCIGVAIEGAANVTHFFMLESKDNTSWSNVTWTQVTSSSFGLWFTAQYYV